MRKPPEVPDGGSPRSIVVLASTFPRWSDDSVPAFVRDFAVATSQVVGPVTVIAPHYRGAAVDERLDGGVRVRRFRYAWPASAQNLVYEGHAAKKVKKNPLYGAKLLAFVTSNLVWTVKESRARNTILNAHWIVPQGFVAIIAGMLTHRPVVVTVHGGDVFTLNGAIVRKVKRWVLRRAAAVVVNSSATLAACRDLYPDREYQVIPMGIDVTRFSPRDDSQREGKFDVLFVGRLSSEKGARYLVEAVRKVRDQRGDVVRLRLVGDGSEREALAQLVAEHGLDEVVTFEGWVQHDDLPAWLHQADVLVGPSLEEANGWKEAFGLTFAEASAAGLAVIGTDTGGIADIVVDGQTGFLVPQRDSDAIATRLLELMDDPDRRRAMGAAGALRMSTRFSWDAVIAKYSAVFDAAATDRAMSA